MKPMIGSKFYILYFGLASCLLFSCFSPIHAAPSQLERSIEDGEKAFTDGNFLKAERFLKKAQSLLDKTQASDERSARVSEKLGESYFKQGKFELADSSYKKSLDLLKTLSLDQSSALSHLKELNEVYRPINLEGFDELATNFARHVGASNACALKQEDSHHIDISLERRFQQKLVELINNFVPKKPDAPALELPKTEGAPEVKQVRLDKKITFDLKRIDGNLQLANIQGIFFDVGLWVKLKDLVMFSSSPEKPEVELTAGAFGVDKKVKTGLPQTVFQRLCEGLDKFDPFSAAAKQENAAPLPSESSGDLQGQTRSNSSNGEITAPAAAPTPAVGEQTAKPALSPASESSSMRTQENSSTPADAVPAAKSRSEWQD